MKKDRPLRIAVVASTFPKLSETFVLNQITGLIRRGHRVTVFSRFSPDEPVAHPDVSGYGLLERTVYFPPVPGRKWQCRLTALGLILRSLFRRPVLTARTVLYNLSSRREFSYPLLFWALTVFREPVDVLLCHFGHNGKLLLPLKAVHPRMAFITMFHGHDIRLGLEGGPGHYADLFAAADLILANSGHTRRQLLELGADPGRTRVHHVGIELDKFPLRPPAPAAQRAARILTVARLHPDKGVDTSIRAVGQLIENDPALAIEYTIVGDGPLEAELKELVHRLNLDRVVTFLGALHQDQVIEQLKSADLFLLTSLHEGLGVVLLEAQAIGIPVVATQVDGIPEAVAPGESALLAPPRDVQAVADALAQCVRCPEKRVQMGQAGRRHVERHFDMEHLNDTLVQIFRELYRNVCKTGSSRRSD